jgi:hypothetical protein
MLAMSFFAGSKKRLQDEHPPLGVFFFLLLLSTSIHIGKKWLLSLGKPHRLVGTKYSDPESAGAATECLTACCFPSWFNQLAADQSLSGKADLLLWLKQQLPQYVLPSADS